MLHGKVVLISGATGALGSAVTREFARAEARLALTGRSEQKLERLAARVGLPAGRVFAASAAVAQADGVRDLVEAIVARFEWDDAFPLLRRCRLHQRRARPHLWGGLVSSEKCTAISPPPG